MLWLTLIPQDQQYLTNCLNQRGLFAVSCEKGVSVGITMGCTGSWVGGGSNGTMGSGGDCCVNWVGCSTWLVVYH